MEEEINIYILPPEVVNIQIDGDLGEGLPPPPQVEEGPDRLDIDDVPFRLS